MIFDFDGVIADTEKLHFEASRVVLARHGVTLDEARYYTRYLGYNDAAMAEAVARDQGRAGPDEDVSGFVREFIHEKGIAFGHLMASGALLFPGAAACIERLAGAFPLAIASGAFREEIERVLDASGLRRHFHAIVGAGDVSHSKPHPAPFLEAARRLGAHPSECVAIEDSLWGLESARAAGMRTIAVAHTSAAARLRADRVVLQLGEITPALVASIHVP